MWKNIVKILILLAVLFLMIRVFNFESNFSEIRENIKEEISDIKNSGEEAGPPIMRNESDETIQDREFQGAADEIIQLANEARFKEELPPLKKNEKLMESAQLKALDMKNKNYFEHISPEGLQPWFFAEKVDYKYKTFGENLAEGFFSAQTVHEGWMNSQGHRENILNKEFEEIGIGLVDFQLNGLKSYLIVQHFGTQLNESDLEPQIICDKKVKKDCKNAENKKEEVEEVIDDQKDEIKKAEKAGIGEEDIKKMEDNLEKLREIEDEIEEYLDKCDEYEKQCDQWQ